MMYLYNYYVIVWVAVVFGINCASNAGRKLVIVRGKAEHYYCFLPTLRVLLIPNTTTNHTTYYKLIQYGYSTLVKRCGHVAHSFAKLYYTGTVTRFIQEDMI